MVGVRGPVMLDAVALDADLVGAFVADHDSKIRTATKIRCLVDGPAMAPGQR